MEGSHLGAAAPRVVARMVVPRSAVAAFFEYCRQESRKRRGQPPAWKPAERIRPS